MRTEKSRPSDERRNALKKLEGTFEAEHISNQIPIQRYYAIADRILESFYTALDKNQLDTAYLYGRRFARFISELLPKHDYYKANKKQYVELRKEYEKKMAKVIEMLEHVVDMMDLEELEKMEIKRREEEARRLIMEREEAMRKEEEERAATQALLDRLNMLDNLGPIPTGVIEKQEKEKKAEDALVGFDDENILGDSLPMPIPFGELHQKTPSARITPPSYDSIPNQKSADNVPLPPPSYDALMQQKGKHSDFRQDSIMNLRPTSSRSISGMGALDDWSGSGIKTFTNPLEGPFGPLVPASLAEHGDVTNKIPPLPFATQKQVAKSEYLKLRGKKMIEVFHLSTYQGRSKAKDSTNGCTVISPLVAVHHLSSDGSGISDFKIEQIIDEIAPNILSRVRNKLGLAPYALIIPSDVHDYLVDEKILKQEMFVGVCGGNVLDSDHVNEFLNLLENGHDSNPGDGVEEKKDMSRKVAAALFFHEHVVSILKVVLADGTSWYDLVDSLPSRKTLNGEDMIGATRTRCKDRQSLEALLRWYACEKFSSVDAKYIDDNEWDDNMCDFDPRVFQGFVWKE